MTRIPPDYCDMSVDDQVLQAIAFLTSGTPEGAASAMEILDLALLRDPVHFEAWNYKADALIQLGRFKEALQCYERLTEIDPHSPGPWIFRGYLLMRLGNNESATASFDRAVMENPDNRFDWMALSEAYRQLGDGNKESFCFVRGSRYPPEEQDKGKRSETPPVEPSKDASTLFTKNKDALPLMMAAITLFQQKQFDQALLHAKKAVAADPDNLKLWNLIAICNQEMGEFDQADEAFRKSIAIDPEGAAAWRGRGRLLGRIGRLEEALSCAEAAIRIAPDDPGTFVLKGRILFHMGRSGEAIRFLDGTGASGTSAGLNQLKGEIFESLERWNEALPCYERVISIDPDYAVRESTHERIGHILKRQGNDREAERWFDQARIEAGKRRRRITGTSPEEPGHDYIFQRQLGSGGFGMVLLAYRRSRQDHVALKTYRDEFMDSPEVKDQFRKEAEIWVRLGHHPNILSAYRVDAISGRHYIAMEYIHPGENGQNSLAGYLKHHPPDLVLSLQWAIQVCYGMEYAYSRGLKCHRDLKPANIMITPEKMVKITDFGLAEAYRVALPPSSILLNIADGTVGLSGSTHSGAIAGTITHMSPEQWISGEGCDERSDLYSFGIILYQMATRGGLPFLPPLPRNGTNEEKVRFESEMFQMHARSPVPHAYSPLDPVIQRCLQKDPSARYGNFGELRAELEQLLRVTAGQEVPSPPLPGEGLNELIARATSLATLGRYEQALTFFDQALAINPSDEIVLANAGACHHKLKQYGRAMECYRQSLKVNPENARTWMAIGACHRDEGRYHEAIESCERSLALDPAVDESWFILADSCRRLRRTQEALSWFEKATAALPENAMLWYEKGLFFIGMKRIQDALDCFLKSSRLNPRDPAAWANLGTMYSSTGNHREAIRCLDKALQLSPDNIQIQLMKAIALGSAGRKSEADALFARIKRGRGR